MSLVMSVSISFIPLASSHLSQLQQCRSRGSALPQKGMLQYGNALPEGSDTTGETQHGRTIARSRAVGLGTRMAQAGGDRATAAPSCRGARRRSKQCWAAACPSRASSEHQPRPRFGCRDRQGRSVPQPRPWAAPPRSASPQPRSRSRRAQPAPGSSAFLRKPLLSAGDTATEYKKTHKHTHKRTSPVPGAQGRPPLQPPCPAQGAS